jgi:hypothetical protein
MLRYIDKDIVSILETEGHGAHGASGHFSSHITAQMTRFTALFLGLHRNCFAIVMQIWLSSITARVNYCMSIYCIDISRNEFHIKTSLHFTLSLTE